MIGLLQSPFTAMLLGGISFLLTMAVLLQKPLQAASQPVPQTETEVVTGFWERHNPEIDQLLEELRNEKEQLAKRATQLRELEARLQSERAEITLVTQRVAELQMEFDQNVVRVKEEETPNLKKLAKMYTTMSAEGAATIMRELDDEVVVKLMSLMKESESAALLDSMAKEGETQAKRAATIAEALRTTITTPKKNSP